MIVFSRTSVLLLALTVFSSLYLKVQNFQMESVQLNEKLMKKIANFSADPCEDFYKYACGNFIKVFPNPMPKKTWGLKKAAELRIRLQLKQLLSENKRDDSNAVNMARKYYQECLRNTWNDETPLLQIIKEFKHWPLYSYNKDWDYQVNFTTLWRIEDFMEKAFKYQAFPIFQISVDKFSPPQIVLGKPEFKESQYSHFKEAVTESLRRLENAHRKAESGKVIKRIRNLIFSSVNMQSHILIYYITTPMGPPYLAFFNMVHMTLKKIEFSYGTANVKKLSEDDEKIVKNMWKMEKELREVLEPSGKLIVEKLKNLNNSLNFTWPCDMQRVLARHFKGTLPDQLIRIYGHQKYLSSLENILKKYSKRTIASYIVWRVIYSLTTKMGKTPYRTLESKQIEWKNKKDFKKAGQCLREVKDRFKFAITKIYAKHYIPKMTRQIVDGIAKHVKLEAFRRKFDFFDEESWRKSKLKIYNLNLTIFYPDFILDNKQLDEYYKLYKGSYLNMNIQHSLMLTHLQREQLHNTYDPKHWLFDPLVANAVYHLGLNWIYIQAGEVPKFHSDGSLEGAFGHIGFMVGHEIAHAILLTGWSVNEEGSFDFWLSENAVRNFQDKFRCYIEQYDRMKMFGRKINGELSVEETMADSAGLFLAYKTLEKLMGTGLKDKTSANLHLTKAQTFFLSFAQSQCEVYYKETSAHIFQENHPFNNIRIKGTLQNSPEFAKAFNCKPGSTYNPRKKCLLFDSQDEQQ